ncbi:uncharacterized protein EDB93DRAFT_1239586 [Suillus bovinus]|uniref:uncharacterized protein n=1 Tax=Suillus bovinus TaxID=48563 RepID=UPI001B86B343|nr:uncharacterized protein EDB93DRAFT_1239586 [Suillus bovinus]KAG2154223.1 hypothetical protein EDB93DRAFT_1239586 [Suillus bovinus]
MNICKCAIGRFFEWDKLDCAVGGSQQALGIKLHQQTQKAIAKHQPALMAALRKFNAYCECLEALYDPHCSIPLSIPLPTKLTNLCNNQSLMEDIWITPFTGKRDRCVEEQQCLGLEADNLCRWFSDELSAQELALLTPGYEKFLVPLRQQQEHLQYIQTCWTTSLASMARFASHATDAVSLAHKLSGVPEECPLQWINTYAVSYVVPTEDKEPGPEIFSDTIHTALQPEDAALVDILTAGVPGGEDDNIDIIVNDPGADLLSAPRFGCPCQVFEPKNIALLASQTALLNDSCINECAVLLYLEAVQLSPMIEQYTILSTHNLPHIRYNAPDDVWILPIHRPSDVGHWVLCVVHLRSKELHLFDSFAERKPWKSDIKCVWVLAMIVVTLHGYHCMTLGEGDMHTF